MSDDLVKRLRIEVNGELGRLKADSRWGLMISEAADRIEALEKEVEDWKKRCVATFIEMIMLGSASDEKANVRALFEDAEELLMEENLK